MIVDRQSVKDFQGHIIGWIETDENGNRTVRDFYRRVLGKYDKKNNVTRDFYGKIVARGDQSSLLIGLSQNK